MASSPRILSAFREIAYDYDALICDVWGVLHNGEHAFEGACEALKTFRARRGPVVLLSNAPRPVADLEKQFSQFGVPNDCYDAIVTSGAAARNDLEARAQKGTVRFLHLGPERDKGLYDGLDVESVDAAHAEVVLCTGLFDDNVETPDDYVDALAELKTRGLTMLCANPDLVVQRGGELIYCAGALAKAYAEIGGDVVYYGKPYKSIYDRRSLPQRAQNGRSPSATALRRICAARTAPDWTPSSSPTEFTAKTSSRLPNRTSRGFWPMRASLRGRQCALLCGEPASR